MSRGCESMGPHFNPDNSPHGGPSMPASARHAGDFGNVVWLYDGKIRASFSDNVATLHGPNTIIGRGIVLHGDTDDLGLGVAASSSTTGNEGPRLACCVILAS